MSIIPDRTCNGCGTTFKPSTLKQTKCKKGCGRKDPNRARTVKRSEQTFSNDLDFIAVDGEGVDRPNGDHDYIMLSVGDKTLTNPDGSALNYDQIFTFLYSAFLENRDAAFIGFALGYDFAMWCKGFTSQEGYMLYSPKGCALRKRAKSPEPYPVYVGGKWEVDLLANKRFRLCPHLCRGPRGTHPGPAYDNCICGLPLRYPEYPYPPMGGTDVEWEAFNPKKRERMYICDTFGFWQSSFLVAVDPSAWHGIEIVTSDEYSILCEGKSKRSDYTIPYGETGHLQEMARYNLTENAVLSRITGTLNEGLVSIGLRLDKRNWYGPGRAAQTWLTHISGGVDYGSRNVPTLSREHHENLLPDYAIALGWQTYYGGWFEQFAHGHIPGTVWEYDINSAYPAVIANLPCLLHGKWCHGKGMVPIQRSNGQNTLWAIYGTFSGSNKYIGALPHRTRTGAIVHPSITRGWYWKHEVDAATRAGLLDTIDIEEWISYEPCDCDPPLRPIRDLYSARVDPSVGKNSPRGKSYKLVYNSAYGKFAQSIGNPRFSNGIYASLITAGCRTQILDSIGSHPQGAAAVTMIATDGIYFTSPHPGLDLTENKLGAWEETELTGMTQLMPGIYWTDKGRDAVRNETRLKMKSRGISASDLANFMFTLDDAFTEFASNLTDWPRLELDVEFSLTSPKQAVQRNKWYLAGRVEHHTERVIDSRPVNKRGPESVYRDGDLVRTGIRSLDSIQTCYYDRRFGYGSDEIEQIKSSLTWGLTQDGEISNQFWDIFK